MLGWTKSVTESAMFYFQMEESVSRHASTMIFSLQILVIQFHCFFFQVLVQRMVKFFHFLQLTTKFFAVLCLMLTPFRLPCMCFFVFYWIAQEMWILLNYWKLDHISFSRLYSFRKVDLNCSWKRLRGIVIYFSPLFCSFLTKWSLTKLFSEESISLLLDKMFTIFSSEFKRVELWRISASKPGFPGHQ